VSSTDIPPSVDSESKSLPPLVVAGVPEHFNLPWHLAIESGQFADAGIAVQYRDVPGGTGEMTNGLRQRSYDLAIVLAEGGVASLLQGNPSWIVKTYVESPLIWGIHVSAESEIQNVDQIRDQRYAISRMGSGSHLMSIVDAAERGWPINELQFEQIGDLDGARIALASGDADTFFWERFTTAPFVVSGEFRRVGERRTLWPAFIVCATEEVLNLRPADVKTVLEIINSNCEALMTNENACELISNRYNLPIRDVEKWFAQTRWSTDFECPVEAIKRIKSYLLELELITEAQSNSRELWFDFSF
jgi:sulfonate transport system substrate-binding protein